MRLLYDYYTGVAPKVMVPILLCWFIKSKAGGGIMAVKPVESSRQ